MSAAGAMDNQISHGDRSPSVSDPTMKADPVYTAPRRRFWFSGIAIVYLVFVSGTLGASILLLAASIRVH